MFSLICAWTNTWANNRDAGGLRRYRVHYDVTVMELNIKMEKQPHQEFNGIHPCDCDYHVLPFNTCTQYHNLYNIWWTIFFVTIYRNVYHLLIIYHKITIVVRWIIFSHHCWNVITWIFETLPEYSGKRGHYRIICRHRNNPYHLNALYSFILKSCTWTILMLLLV